MSSIRRLPLPYVAGALCALLVVVVAAVGLTQADVSGWREAGERNEERSRTACSNAGRRSTRPVQLPACNQPPVHPRQRSRPRFTIRPVPVPVP